MLKNGNGSESISTFRDEYDFLSNFYPCSIVYQGMWYQNAEAAFQAQKCINEEDKQVFCGLPAAKAKRHGRQVKLRPDWESVKIGLMAEIVKAKFSQNIHLAKKLLATGDRQLFEKNTWGDTFWGVDGCTGEGENHLGQILMQVRRELAQEGEQERKGEGMHLRR